MIFQDWLCLQASSHPWYVIYHPQSSLFFKLKDSRWHPFFIGHSYFIIHYPLSFLISSDDFIWSTLYRASVLFTAHQCNSTTIWLVALPSFTEIFGSACRLGCQHGNWNLHFCVKTRFLPCKVRTYPDKANHHIVPIYSFAQLHYLLNHIWSLYSGNGQCYCHHWYEIEYIFHCYRII